MDSEEQTPSRTRVKSKEEILVDLATEISLNELATAASKVDEDKEPSVKDLGSPNHDQHHIPEVVSPEKIDTPDGSKNGKDDILEIKEDHFPMEHVVDARDTLDKVAAMYHTTPTRLAQYNKLTSRFIFAGQVRQPLFSLVFPY
jgi:LysM repeat protein